jgi:hypothetical protein
VIENEQYLICDECGKKVLRSEAIGWVAIFLSDMGAISEYADVCGLEHLCSLGCLQKRLNEYMQKVAKSG